MCLLASLSRSLIINLGRSNSAKQHHSKSESNAQHQEGPSDDFVAELASRSNVDSKIHADRLSKAGERQNLRLKIGRPESIQNEYPSGKLLKLGFI